MREGLQSEMIDPDNICQNCRWTEENREEAVPVHLRDHVDRPTSEPRGMWSGSGLVVLLMILMLDLVSVCSTIHGEIYIMKYSNKALKCGAERRTFPLLPGG